MALTFHANGDSLHEMSKYNMYEENKEKRFQDVVC